MDAVEIGETILAFAELPFDAPTFAFDFLTAFGNKDTTIKRLHDGGSNKSDAGGVLQPNNIHIMVCPPGQVTDTVSALRACPATARHKAKFVLATDGITLEPVDLTVYAPGNQLDHDSQLQVPLMGAEVGNAVRR